MSEEKLTYGKVTVGAETADRRDVEIISFLQATFLNARLASICQLEDGSYTLNIENPASSGRSNQGMLLSKESLLGLMSVSMLFFQFQGLDFETELEKALGNSKEISYSCSDNINPKINTNESI